MVPNLPQKLDNMSSTIPRVFGSASHSFVDGNDLAGATYVSSTTVIDELLGMLREDDSCDLHVLCDGLVYPMHRSVVFPQSRGLRRNYWGQRRIARVGNPLSTFGAAVLTSGQDEGVELRGSAFMSLDMDHRDLLVIIAFFYGEYQYVIDTPDREVAIPRHPHRGNGKANGSINVALCSEAHPVESLFRVYKFARMLEIDGLQRLVANCIQYWG